MLVSDVVTQVSSDMRSVLASTGSDAAIFIPWVDRVQKECLHSSTYNYLLQSMETVSLVQNTSSYTLGSVPRKIHLVYDRTFDRIIKDMDNPPADAGGTPQAQITNSQWTEYFKRSGTATFYVFPSPQKAIENATLEVHYEQYAPDVANLTDTLTLPNDSMDVVVAGVNMYAAQFLKLGPDAATWGQLYNALKGQ